MSVLARPGQARKGLGIVLLVPVRNNARISSCTSGRKRKLLIALCHTAICFSSSFRSRSS
jgi:hypothetical protein